MCGGGACACGAAGAGAGAGALAGGGGAPASPLTCLAVCFLVLTYNLLGGFLFLALEGGGGAEAAAASAPQPRAPAALRARTVERLWAITEDLNILYKENWTRLAARELLDFQAALARSLPPAAPAAPARHRWTFSTSFLYALTLITTIGHGEVTPRSAAGKLVAMAYASVGIPLVMLYLATIGGALARRARALYARLRPGPRAPAPARKPAPREPRTPFQAALNLESVPAHAGGAGGRGGARVPAALALLLLALYVALGAALFHATERWSPLDGCFFSFSSLATIGMGALRPGARAAALSSAAEDLAIGLCCIYILVGIVVVAMCFDLIREDLGAALRGVSGLRARGAVHGAAGGGDKAAAAAS